MFSEMQRNLLFIFNRRDLPEIFRTKKFVTYLREKIPIFDQRFCQTFRFQAVDDCRIPEQ